MPRRKQQQRRAIRTKKPHRRARFGAKTKRAQGVAAGIAIVCRKNRLHLFYKDGRWVRHAVGADGFAFVPSAKKISSFPAPATPATISSLKGINILLYAKKGKGGGVPRLAVSKDLRVWKEFSSLPSEVKRGGVAPGLSRERRFALYYGGKDIRIAYSQNLSSWKFAEYPAYSAAALGAGERLDVSCVASTPKGIVLIYGTSRNGATHTVGALLFDVKEPSRLLWQSPEPLWEAREEAGVKLEYIGAAVLKGTALLYWNSKNGIVARALPWFLKWVGGAKSFSPALLKHQGNPIIRPRAENRWESRATFNPAALYEGGAVHLLYRAIGDADTSVIGYAASRDGLSLEERLPEPAYLDTHLRKPRGEPYASPFMSGGGCFGGCEDPRLTRLGDAVYMTYVAYDGWGPPRVALTSISLENFLKKRWRWRRPVLISPPGIVNKNACILPEKINGKYVIFHRVFPNILIDFVDNLNFDGKTKWLAGHYKIAPRPGFWDSRKVGVGAPPIKTKDGWLLIYHAVGEQDPGRYKVGAMLLDGKDPTKVLRRSRKPILEPAEHYENGGHKSGVAYPCGAVVIGPDLFVYYGGADTVTCVATARLDEFLEKLKATEDAALSKPVVIAPSQ